MWSLGQTYSRYCPRLVEAIPTPQLAEDYLREKYENHNCVDAKPLRDKWTYPAKTEHPE